MTNCPNCGSPIEPYKVRCDYCGTYYFDFTSIDMTENKPYFVKFRVDNGLQKGSITTLAKPRLNTVELTNDPCYITDRMGNVVTMINDSHSCTLEVSFDCLVNPEDKSLFKLEVEK